MLALRAVLHPTLRHPDRNSLPRSRSAWLACTLVPLALAGLGLAIIGRPLGIPVAIAPAPLATTVAPPGGGRPPAYRGPDP